MSLPGIRATIKDKFYSLSQTNIPTGPKVLIIGKRTTDDRTSDGEIEVRDLDPYYATREDRVVAAFGSGSQLHRGFKEALAGGAQRIFMVALPSDTVFDYDAGTISSAAFNINNPGNATAADDDNLDLFQAAFAAAETVRPDIIVPWGRGGHPSDWESPATPGNDDDQFGFYADNGTTTDVSFAYKVAVECSKLTEDSHPCIGVMGIKPHGSTSESLIPSEVSSHLRLPNLISRELMGDYGRVLVVVAGELRPVGYRYADSQLDFQDFGYSNGAAMLAGDISRRDSWSSPTGKSIFNLTSMRYTPSKASQLSLIDKAVSPTAVTYNRTPAWVDVMTFSKSNSDYARLTTVRIVFDAVQLVRQAARPFIGEAATLQTRNALETAITSGLRGMQQLGALYASTPSFTYNPLKNEVLVDLVLVPAFELRNVEVQVSVNLSAEA